MFVKVFHSRQRLVSQILINQGFCCSEWRAESLSRALSQIKQNWRELLTINGQLTPVNWIAFLAGYSIHHRNKQPTKITAY